MTDKAKFEIGEEIVGKIDGAKGYIVNSFKACIVKFDLEVRVIPEENLVQEEIPTLKRGQRSLFQKGDKVIYLNINRDGLEGEVFANKWFYVVHLFKGGELKVVIGDILAKKGTKIVPKIILTPAPGQRFGRDLPGQGKVFSNN